ncbi:MAG: hypothetical protein A2X50_08855 [Candidatus Rokubacteria bacterium GWF2_70_14]|nr:MAG: hypothetical protein A2X50_08855 [Candidatus Rokubacteria bacterium GWF2_70_14]
MLGVTPDDRGLWLLSSRGRDRLSLVRVDLATGAESLVHEDPRLDLEWAIMSARTRTPLAVVTYPGRQAIHFFDPSLQADLEPLRRGSPTGFHILSVDAAGRFLTVEVFTERGYENYLGAPARPGRQRPVPARDDGFHRDEVVVPGHGIGGDLHDADIRDDGAETRAGWPLFYKILRQRGISLEEVQHDSPSAIERCPRASDATT